MMHSKRYRNLFWIQLVLVLGFMVYGAYKALTNPADTTPMLMVVWGFFLLSDLRRDTMGDLAEELRSREQLTRKLVLNNREFITGMERSMFDRFDGLARFIMDRTYNPDCVRKVAEEAPVGWSSPAFEGLEEDTDGEGTEQGPADRGRSNPDSEGDGVAQPS